MKTVEECARHMVIRYGTSRKAIEVATLHWAVDTDNHNPIAAYWRDVVNEIKRQEEQ